MSNWSDRLKSKMHELGMTQEELAKTLGLSRSAIGHYMTGTRHPPLKQFVKIATLLKTDPAWLQFGKISSSDTKVSNSKTKANGIPLLTWQEVAEASTSVKSKSGSRLEYTNLGNNDCYALEVKTDSMSSANGVSFNPGSYIIIDPNKVPEHNSYLVFVNPPNKNEALFRQFIEEGGSKYLKALNPQYGMQEMTSKTKILGVIIAQINVF